MKLANAYSDISNGDRATKIQWAIECCNSVLRVYTGQAYPQEYGIVIDGLENARKLMNKIDYGD